MYSLAFYLHKGGTGKSTMSIMVGQLLGLMGKKVVIVDCDTQGNTSTQLLESIDYLDKEGNDKDKIKELIPFELSDVLAGNCYLSQSIKEVRENLSIVPTRPTAHSGLIRYSETMLPNELFAFEDLNSALEEMGYEYIIYDMSPASGMLESRVLKAVREVIPVTNIGLFSMKGLGGLIQFKDTIEKQCRTKIKWNKIILNRINKAFKQTAMSEKAIESLNAKVYKVPQSISIENLLSEYKTLIDIVASDKREEDKILKELIPLAKDLIKEVEG